LVNGNVVTHDTVTLTTILEEHTNLYFQSTSFSSTSLLTMSGGVRARRPASPPLGLPHTASTSQRFPHPREGHLDADARKASASKGLTPGRKHFPLGGLKLTSGEWKLLLIVVLIASAVRLFRLSKPNSVV